MVGLATRLRRTHSTAAAFDPNVVAGLRLWLPASGTYWQNSTRTTPATADTDPVGAWDDASGNGFHMLQATSGKRPLLKTGIVGGRSGLRFDGTDDFLSGSLVTAATANFVTFVVSQRAGNAKGHFIKNGGASDGWGNGIGNGDMDTTGAEFLGLQEAIAWNDPNLTSPATPSLFIEETWAATQGFFGVNTLSLTFLGLSTPNTPTSQTSIGGNSAGSRCIAADIVEVLVYACASSGAADTCVSTIGAALATRHGITLT